MKSFSPTLENDKQTNTKTESLLGCCLQGAVGEARSQHRLVADNTAAHLFIRKVSSRTLMVSQQTALMLLCCV